MSLGTRDAEAFSVVRSRRFDAAALVAAELEMQTRRLSLRVYGALEGDGRTYLATITFFGAQSLSLEGGADAFPQSAALSGLDLTYDDDADIGSAAVRGAKGWTLAFAFDGVAYEQTPAVLSSLADDG